MPKISQELKELLQLSPNNRTGDWYIFENHTIIRIYGFEGQPYIFSAFLTPMVYALEFMRERLTYDQLHFVGNNKASTFRL